MKKIIVFLFITSLLLIIINTKQDNLRIPDNSIRFRIIASSNETQDQALKNNIVKDLLPFIENIESSSTDITTSRIAIKNSIPKIKEVLDKKNIKYSINYGNNPFPEKTFQNVTYEAKDYESLVISLGESKGNNWWCVLFPPLCLIEANKNDLSQVEYDLYIKNILKKF